MRSFPVRFSEGNIHAVLERNHAFLILGTDTLSTRNTGDKSRLHDESPISGDFRQCLSSDVPADYPCSTNKSKVRIEIQVKIEDVLLRSVIHAIRIGTESMLWPFIRFR